MKQLFLFPLFLFIVNTALAQHDHASNPIPKAKQEVIYTCVMHPEIQKSKPGNCPKCGMKLVRKVIKSAPSSPAIENKKENKPEMSRDDPSEHTGMSVADMEDKQYVAETVNMEPGKVVRYDLYVTDTIVNFTGKRKHAYAINGSIPAPVLTFTEGDTAEIYLHNNLKREQTSLHWHGVILPNQADGVPLLTTARIRPGETHLYKFPIVQNGTYWYHSHSGLQEQAGMYGALVFKKREQHKTSKGTGGQTAATISGFDKEYVLVLSEWADEKPMQIQRRLRTGNDWYSIKKGSTQSYSEAITQKRFKTKLINEWKRMKAMDVSDVYYNKFLSNGKPESSFADLKAGQKVKLRIVNGGASSYFWLQYAGGKISVIGSDGNDMEPTEVDRLIVAPAETYDLLVTIPENRSYEFRATPEDRTGATSLWLGSGMKMPAPVLPRLNYFAGMKMMNDMMKTNGQMKDMQMEMRNRIMDMNTVMYPEITGNSETDKKPKSKLDSTRKSGDMDGMNMDGMNMENGDIVSLTYEMLRSPVKTTLQDGLTKNLHFMLTGNMNRYVWTLDNKTVKEAERIFIKQGENVRIIITNNSMMRHPMHLHGHDFRVLNSQGEYAPLKNVIDIMPMETDTIEFAANQSGNWFFHCHILFHMMAGMGRVFSYENSPINPELPDAEKAYRQFKRQKDQNMHHLMIRAGLESNGSDGEAMLSTDRSAIQQIWHLGLRPAHGYESETNIGRYFGRNQWWFAYAGFDYHYKIIDPVMENGHGLMAKNIFGDEGKNLLGQTSNKTNRKTIVAGVQYTLPMLVLADFRVDGNGKFRFQIGREDIPITKRLRFNLMVNTDKEYMAGFRYVVNKWLAASTHYDSDMGLGAGLTVTY
ncbi:MAG: multicopper oxidase domain-containing protein [Taibaiella sp.]|nr:multicopper oxidase domain-containing protein [Taibaiella sp.]